MGGGRHDELACGEAARAVLQLIACVEQHGQALAYIRLDTDALDEHEPCLCTRLHLPHSTGRVGISEGVVLTSGHALEHLQLGKDVAPIRIPLLAPLRAFCASGAWTHMSVYSRRGGLVHGRQGRVHNLVAIDVHNDRSFDVTSPNDAYRSGGPRHGS